MIRSSMASSRASSHLPGSQPPNAAALSKLTEKKKEFDAVSALERSSALFLKRIEGLAEDCEIMAEAGVVNGQVLAQWPQMFRILNMFLSARAETEEGGATGAGDASAGGERLVRVPVDELLPAEQ
ncbi:hypothetical protein OF83DRAFT_1157426 [Amylostereum chailletii]|nr:hypothetical protein OF83DRAFT_1157426 [Amylostereum chailletii]